MIHEDLLLSRIDILENKLSCYQKNITNEKLQEQITQLQDEKEVYQVSVPYCPYCRGLFYKHSNQCNPLLLSFFSMYRKPLRKP